MNGVRFIRMLIFFVVVVVLLLLLCVGYDGVIVFVLFRVYCCHAVTVVFVLL